MEIHGYKALSGDCSTRNGMILRPKRIYISNSVVKFRYSGFHFCKRLEDTLRYFDGFKEINFAKVVGMGQISEYEDEYYGYYDMYAASELYVDHILTKEEINAYFDKLLEKSSYYPEGVFRVIQGYKLSDEQKNNILDKAQGPFVREKYYKAIQYYQEGNKDIYSLTYR